MNKIESILSRYCKEGRVQVITDVDNQKSTDSINAKMKIIKSKYNRKQQESIEFSSRIILNR